MSLAIFQNMRSIYRNQLYFYYSQQTIGNWKLNKTIYISIKTWDT